MKVLSVRNVNCAYYEGMQLLKDEGRLISPRGMDTLEVPCPVATVYQNPTERVCMISERDANPFFHLFESIWILAGRRDVEWLAQFNSNIANFSDDGELFHAGYGYRLRKQFGMDQIDEAMEVLKESEDTRQAVLQIWNCITDLNCDSKDIPCNDIIFLKIRGGRLNITVCCRSNDVIWGAYGANVVQFSMLQEYIATKLGIEVGTYTQISDSFHAYIENPQFETMILWSNEVAKMKAVPDLYRMVYIQPYPIMDVPDKWDEDAKIFVDHSLYGIQDNAEYKLYRNKWFRKVACPMFLCWKQHKINGTGLSKTNLIQATDWRKAAEQWFAKREDIKCSG